jgi:hypothetical protein
MTSPWNLLKVNSFTYNKLICTIMYILTVYSASPAVLPANWQKRIFRTEFRKIFLKKHYREVFEAQLCQGQMNLETVCFSLSVTLAFAWMYKINIYRNIFIVFGFLADTFHHKVHTYIEYHSVCPLVGIGTLPPPLSPASVPLPPEPKGGGHNRLQVRGWGSPNSDDWRRSLALCLLCAFHNILIIIFSAIKSFWMYV